MSAERARNKVDVETLSKEKRVFFRGRVWCKCGTVSSCFLDMNEFRNYVYIDGGEDNGRGRMNKAAGARGEETHRSG